MNIFSDISTVRDARPARALFFLLCLWACLAQPALWGQGSMDWYSGAAAGSGDFDIPAAGAHDVDVLLADEDANGPFASGWDGRSLTKLGGGTLILSEANTYTGTTLVSAGTLRAGVADTIAQSSHVIVDAVFDLGGYNQQLTNLSGAGAGFIMMGASTLTVGNNTDTVYSGRLAGAGARLVKTGASTLTLAGNGNFASTLVDGGTLVITGIVKNAAAQPAQIAQAGSADAAVLVANGGSWIVDGGAFSVGHTGTGRLDIRDDNSKVEVRSSAILGVGQDSDGRARVADGALLRVDDDVYIGHGGKGVLEVADNGRVEIGDDICIGGTHATGDGYMDISGQGRVSNAKGAIGYKTANSGSVRVSDSAVWENSNFLHVGLSGTGVLELAGSGSLKSVGGSVGFAGTASGTVTLSDNSRWENTGDFVIGHEAGSKGNVSIADAASIGVSDAMLVGEAGTGSVELRDNARADAGSSVEIGFGAGSSGTIIVAGNASLEATGEIDVGYEGAGMMELRDNARVTTGRHVAIASQAGSSGTLALNGGVLEASRVLGGDGAASLRFNSGTLRAIGNNTDFISATGPAQLDAGGGTIDTAAFDITVASGFTGAGMLRKTGAGTLALTAASDHTGGTEIGQGVLVITHTSALGATGEVTVQDDAALHVRTGPVVFANTLAGGGLIDVRLDAPGNTFAFSPNTPGIFTGTARFGDSTFDLTEEATALAAATMEVGAGNTTIVSGTGARTVGGLILNGGRMDFDVVTPADIEPQAFVQVTGTLAIEAGGLIAIDTPAIDTDTLREQLPLLRQDDGHGVRLIASATTTGAPSNLAPIDLSGNPIASPQSVNINQNGLTVATGTYDYGFDVFGDKGSGLYVSYALRAVDIIDGRTLVLEQDAAAPPGADEFHAVISGNGDLVIAASAAITLNAENTYTGTTFVNSGTLIAGANNALGNTAFLHVAPAAAFDLNGRAQTIRGGGEIEGRIQGSGTLTLLDSLFTVHSANTGFAALVNTTGTIRLAHVQGLGDASTVSLNNADAALILDPDADGDFVTAITGDSGSFIKDGPATVTIARANDYSGSALINAGTLSATDAAALGSAAIDIATDAVFEYRDIPGGVSQNTIGGPGTLTIASSTLALARDNSMARVNIDRSTVTMTAGNALGGANATITMSGGGSAIRIDTPAAQLGTLNMNGGLLAFAPPGNPSAPYHRASIAALGPAPGNFLFNVDFAGADGLMTPASGMKANSLAIADDSAAAAPHHMRVDYTGAPASGSSSFELITTGNGAAEFILDTNNGKIDIGAISYELNRGDGTELMPDSNNWYLAGSGPSNAIDIIDVAATIPLDWNIALDALYLRMGDIHSDAANAASSKAGGNVWVRARGYRMNAANSATARSFMQHGWGATAGADKAFHAQTGLNFLGGFIDMGAINRDYDRRGDSETHEIAAGLYLTHIRRDGWFADIVARAARYSNNLNARTPDNRAVKGRYNNRAAGISIEAGRRLRHAGGWWVEPTLQASALWLDGARFDTTPGDLRIRVEQDNIFSMQYRALVRFGKQIGGGKWRPYGKFGVVALDTDGGSLRADGEVIAHGYDGRRVELGLGASYRTGPDSDLYLDYEYARAAHYERPWTLNLGFRRLW